MLFVVLACALGLSLLLARLQRQNRELTCSEERHRALFEHSKLPMLLIHPESGRIIDANDAAATFYGYSHAQLCSLTIGDINQLPPDAIRAEMALARRERRSCFYFPHRLANGEIRQVEVHSGPLEVGGQTLLYSFVHDVTERKLAQERLVQLLAEQKALLNNDLIGIVTVKDRTIVWASPAFEKMMGYGSGELAGTPTLANYLDPATHAAIGAEAYATLAAGGVFRKQVQLHRKDGSCIWLDASAELLNAQTGESLWGFIDITQRKLMEDQVRQLAFHDVLTGLPNRRLLLDRLGQAMSASKRSGHHAAILFLDLDNFKPVNDAHGHEAGDLLLLETARRLTACVREIDTIARFGGDEFVVMLSDLHTDRQISLLQAHAVAEKIRVSLSQPYALELPQRDSTAHTVHHRCTVSVGVRVFLDHHGSADDILSQADAAMYQAKQAGRNTIRMHQESDLALTR